MSEPVFQKKSTQYFVAIIPCGYHSWGTGGGGSSGVSVCVCVSRGDATMNNNISVDWATKLVFGFFSCTYWRGIKTNMDFFDGV